MNRSYGNQGIALVECVNPYKNKYRVRWDIRPDEREGIGNGAITFVEHQFNHKPTLDEIQETILTWYNEQIDYKILSGFKWREYDVWLSTENQFNYKAAYDLAVQTNGTTLPVTFKFDTTKNPAYFTFQNLDDLNDFYVSAMAYINSTLANGWQEKDSLDWEQWSQYL